MHYIHLSLFLRRTEPTTTGTKQRDRNPEHGEALIAGAAVIST